MKHRLLILATLCLGSIAAFPTQAKADSCKPLLKDFYNYVGQGGYIGFLHTTNYQAHGYWANAHSWGYFVFSSGNALMSGVAHRTWNDGRAESFDVTFYQNGTVYFGPYGPYTPSCYGNKFLVVNSGDSFETFTFTKGYYEQR
jgi:hypothetical protein